MPKPCIGCCECDADGGGALSCGSGGKPIEDVGGGGAPSGARRPPIVLCFAPPPRRLGTGGAAGALSFVGGRLNVESREGGGVGVPVVGCSYVSVFFLSRSTARPLPVPPAALRTCPKACDSPSKCTLIAAW